MIGIGIALVVVVILMKFGMGTPPESTEKDTSSPVIKPKQEKTMKKPDMIIDQNKKYAALLQTSEGDIQVELFAKKTPVTVNNFVYLSREKFYDGTTFHRIIKDFMIQGGDPQGDGTGGPGYRFDDEVFDGEYTKGTVAMANAGPNTNGSQFFIMTKDTPLPKNYVIFGKVTKGLDVLDTIAATPVERGVSGENSSPTEPVFIEKVTINEK